jgi:glycosyltransferase involved in cell wall biosynthesis
LHVGRIDDRKGIDTAIRALPLLPAETRLDIVGRGDDRHQRELRALVDTLGLADRVGFAVAERGELAEIYAAADVLLFLPRWAEPFGLVPLEAMASSTPVVATGTGGSGEFLVDGANCLRVPVDDHAAVALAVRRLARDAGLRNQLVAGGYATAAELSLPRWVDILQRWHAAAADRFCAGQPLDREPIERTLARIGTAETK